MIALDTNVVVRFLTGDHPEQSARARDLILNRPVFASATVILECEWGLRSAYGLDRAAVIRALRSFAGLPSVTIGESRRIADALDAAEAGMDFADALHLFGSADCEAFASFDRAMAALAARRDIMMVFEP